MNNSKDLTLSRQTAKFLYHKEKNKPPLTPIKKNS